MLELSFVFRTHCPAFLVGCPSAFFQAQGKIVVSVLRSVFSVCFCTVTSTEMQFMKCFALHIIVSGKESSIKIILI